MRPSVVAVRLWAASRSLRRLAGPADPREVLFAPLLATWSVCVGMAISVRSTDVRVAQQLSTLASLPPLGLAILITFRVIAPTVLWRSHSASLRRARCLAWWGAAMMLDRERLIVGKASARSRA